MLRGLCTKLGLFSLKGKTIYGLQQVVEMSQETQGSQGNREKAADLQK